VAHPLPDLQDSRKLGEVVPESQCDPLLGVRDKSDGG
jgi:hypothetical protein